MGRRIYGLGVAPQGCAGVASCRPRTIPISISSLSFACEDALPLELHPCPVDSSAAHREAMAAFGQLLAAAIALFMEQIASPQYTGVNLYSRSTTESGRKFGMMRAFQPDARMASWSASESRGESVVARTSILKRS